jgi:dTDP-glucose 4,6-dehydratase
VPLTVHGDGGSSRDWLYVDDDAEAIEAIIEAPLDRVAGETINVATGIDIPVAEIADLVLELLGRPASLRENVEERLGQVRRHIGSTDKAEQLLGWRARTRFEDGLERTVAWYRENDAWWRAILGAEARAFSS